MQTCVRTHTHTHTLNEQQVVESTLHWNQKYLDCHCGSACKLLCFWGQVI